ncbi:MAG TPA: Uma2 family endonuclease [Blastocatellia bacterium]|nr:Uma2 family endonuclease [Blastocatellia bacterium]
MTALPKHKYTLEEYFELERNSDEKYEYFNGEVFAMAGGSSAHSRISVNAISVLVQKLRGKSCEVFNSDMRIKVPAAFPYRYPDVSGVCGTPVFDEIQGQQMLVNPILIVEVLSPSTAAYDLGEKFTAYQSIESFQEYLLIYQDRPLVIQYQRQSQRRWLRIENEGLQSQVELQSINVSLSLSEIYERVNFDLQEAGN